jgi:HlyD family secretion protein
VQSVAIEPGARVEPGSEIARIADQHDLQAALEVSETEVHDVAIGMPARIDTGFGVLSGRVTRIAPAAENGSVEVGVAFSRRLPAAVRPDLTVDGTIALSRLANVISIERPAGAVDDTTVQLYRVQGNVAHLIVVRLGHGSSDRVQVLSGLRPGDTVIVSDMSSYGGAPSLRIR